MEKEIYCTTCLEKIDTITPEEYIRYDANNGETYIMCQKCNESPCAGDRYQ